MRALVAASALAVFSLTMVAGCGSNTAAPPSVDRQAMFGLVKGVNFVLVNDSGEVINLTSVKSDSSNGLGDLADGGTASIQGCCGYDVSDVTIDVRFSNNDTLRLDAFNPAFKPPVITFQKKERWTFKEGGGGVLNRKFEGHGITIEHQPDDDDWVQFTITFTGVAAESTP